MSWDKDAFKEKVESEHKFPGEYVFKFIVPFHKKEEVVKILPKGSLSFRNSSGSKYQSITLKVNLKNADEVISVYEKAYKIEGIVAL